jgi:hypothetical protein
MGVVALRPRLLLLLRLRLLPLAPLGRRLLLRLPLQMLLARKHQL